MITKIHPQPTLFKLQMNCRFRLALLLFATVFVLASQYCSAAESDPDADGWYSAKKNQRVTLTLVSLTSNRQGDYYLTADGVRFPHDEKNLLAIASVQPDATKKIDQVVATRAVGTWQPPSGKQHTWKTIITVVRLGSPNEQRETTVTWDNHKSDFTASVSFSPDEQVSLVFRVDVERFKDPSPNDRRGDADHDGLLDWEEADYARHGVGLGDPGRRDLILVAAHTHDTWRMTEQTKTLLKTRFLTRGIHLYIASNDAESLGLCRPGLVKLKGRTIARDYPLSLKEARRIRKKYLKSPMADNAHLVILSALVSPKPSSSWGYADLPGSTLVVRSHLPMLGPDFHQYQAKTLMHELGHNLGLYHPEQSNARCLSGPIPVSERSAATTVMGTPRADRGNPLAALANAWSRPLDYSPTQWKNARLDWVRPENRPKRRSVKK